MTELQDFLDDMLPRQEAAEREMHNGDAAQRRRLWSENDPLTLLGAAIPCQSGAEEVRAAFGTVASWFSDCTAYDFEVVAAGASGDLAYTVGIERTSCTVEGKPTDYALRATHVYRRENGDWRIVHRHADPLPEDVRVTRGAVASVLEPE